MNYMKADEQKLGNMYCTIKIGLTNFSHQSWAAVKSMTLTSNIFYKISMAMYNILQHIIFQTATNQQPKQLKKQSKNNGLNQTNSIQIGVNNIDNYGMYLLLNCNKLRKLTSIYLDKNKIDLRTRMANCQLLNKSIEIDVGLEHSRYFRLPDLIEIAITQINLTFNLYIYIMKIVDQTKINNESIRHLTKARWPLLLSLHINCNNIGIDGLNAMRGNSWVNMNDFVVEPIDYICYLQICAGVNSKLSRISFLFEKKRNRVMKKMVKDVLKSKFKRYHGDNNQGGNGDNNDDGQGDDDSLDDDDDDSLDGDDNDDDQLEQGDENNENDNQDDDQDWSYVSQSQDQFEDQDQEQQGQEEQDQNQQNQAQNQDENQDKNQDEDQDQGMDSEEQNHQIHKKQNKRKNKRKNRQ